MPELLPVVLHWALPGVVGIFQKASEYFVWCFDRSLTPQKLFGQLQARKRAFRIGIRAMPYLPGKLSGVRSIAG